MKNRVHTYINIEKLIVLTIILTPLLFYSYLLFPSKPEMNIFSFTFVSRYFDDVQIFVWIIFIKLSLIVLLSIWFVTNDCWWRFAIIPILCYTTFQFVSAINDEFMLFKNYGRWHGILISILLIPLYMYVHKRLNYKPLSFSEKIENSAIEKLVELIEFDRAKYSDLESKLHDLKNSKQELSKKEYLYKLMAIQSAIDDSIMEMDESSREDYSN